MKIEIGALFLSLSFVSSFSLFFKVFVFVLCVCVSKNARTKVAINTKKASKHKTAGNNIHIAMCVCVGRVKIN